MAQTLNALNISAPVFSRFRLLSISLTGEIAPTWLAASWGACKFQFDRDRFPDFQTKLRRWETFAVAAMVATLFLDFFVFRSTLFIAITHFLLLFQIV